MNIGESITKAAQGMSIVVSDLSEVLQSWRDRPMPTEGRSTPDRATTMYLVECLEQARKLQNRLAMIES